MQASGFSKWAVVFSGAMFLGLQAMAQQPTTAATKRAIVVSLEDRKLALLEDGQVRKIYSVGVGKPPTPSPIGTFVVERKVKNPTYHHDGKTVLPGVGNPVGTRWIGLSIKGFGIHGTNEPKSIGKASSHGCIRMAKADLEEFYDLVTAGDTVEFVGHRNEETAQLFGIEPKPTSLTANRNTLLASTVRDEGAAPRAGLLAVDGVAVGGSW